MSEQISQGDRGSGLGDLPPEIILNLCDNINGSDCWFYPELREKKQTFSNLSQTCRALYNLVQPYLYSNFTSHSMTEPKRPKVYTWARAVICNPKLGSAVRDLTLELIPWTSLDPGLGPASDKAPEAPLWPIIRHEAVNRGIHANVPDRVFLDPVVRDKLFTELLISCLPNLERLNISLPAQHYPCLEPPYSWKPDKLKDLRLLVVHLPNSRESVPTGDVHTQVTRLVNAAKNLEHFKFSGAGDLLSGFRFNNLTSLEIDGDWHTVNELNLLAASTPGLNTFIYNIRQPSMRHFGRHLESEVRERMAGVDTHEVFYTNGLSLWRDTLEHLEIHFWFQPGFVRSIRSLERMHRLQYLKLDVEFMPSMQDIFWFSGTQDLEDNMEGVERTPATSNLLMGFLPSSIEKVYIQGRHCLGTSFGESPKVDEIARQAGSGQFPLLQKIFLSTRDDQDGPAQQPTWTKQINGFNVWREDWRIGYERAPPNAQVPVEVPMGDVMELDG